MIGEVPQNWAITTIEKLTDYVQRGIGPKYSESNAFPVVNQKSIRWHGINEEHLKYVHAENWNRYSKERFIKRGDILWNSTGIGTIGRACLLNDTEAAKAKVVDSHVTIVRPNKIVEPRFLFYWIKSPAIQLSIDSLYTGTTNQVELSKSKVLETQVPLAPLNEQIRIANKLDQLLAKVNVAQTRLEKIPKLLKRFRIAVLAAATSGELTKEWREKNPTQWELLLIDDVAEVKGGKRLPNGDELVEVNTGLPYIRAGQLKQGTVINTNHARSRQLFLTPDTQAKISRYIVNKGDVYLTIVGASIGDAGVIPNHYDGANLTENAAKITEFKKPLVSDFLAYWLRSQKLQDLIKQEIKSGAQGKLALKRIKELPIPYTNINEQKEIVHRVESLLSQANILEKQYAEAKKRIDRLTQSLLAKAFRGELVPQDPNDEPASELLKRIQIERENKAEVKPKHIIKAKKK